MLDGSPVILESAPQSQGMRTTGKRRAMVSVRQMGDGRSWEDEQGSPEFSKRYVASSIMMETLLASLCIAVLDTTA